MKPRAAMCAAVMSVVAVAGCDGDPPPQPDTTARVTWERVSLPPDAQGEHAAVRAGAACDGVWYLTGAIIAADGTPRPAAWTSTDANSFTAMRLTPHSYYGKLDTLYAAGCRNGRLAAIGAKSGGAHGFPRTSNWYQLPDLTLDEYEANYTVYGGPEGVNVSRTAGGPQGWLEAGNKTSGATAWLSTDGRLFRTVAGAPNLANDSTVNTYANDVVAVPSGWLIVGAVTATGSINRDPGAWSSADGLTWRRMTVPGGPEYEEIRRAALVNGVVVGVGTQGDAFGAWRGGSAGTGEWRPVGRFGASGGPGRGSVAELTAVGGRLFAVVGDGTSYAVWTSADLGSSWSNVPMPAPAPVRVDTATVTIATGGRIVMAIDSGQSTSVWMAVPNGLS